MGRGLPPSRLKVVCSHSGVVGEPRLETHFGVFWRPQNALYTDALSSSNSVSCHIWGQKPRFGGNCPYPNVKPLLLQSWQFMKRCVKVSLHRLSELNSTQVDWTKRTSCNYCSTQHLGEMLGAGGRFTWVGDFSPTPPSLYVQVAPV